MFTGELAESRQTEITIRDIDELAMESLIDFCYTSHVAVEESNVQTLLPAGDSNIYTFIIIAFPKYSFFFNIIHFIFFSLPSAVGRNSRYLLRVFKKAVRSI